MADEIFRIDFALMKWSSIASLWKGH